MQTWWNGGDNSRTIFLFSLQNSLKTVKLRKNHVIITEMSSQTDSKKEIRLKVENKFYHLLQVNADQYGVKPSDYIIHLILDDIKSSKPKFISDEVESNLTDVYAEIAEAKSHGTFQGKSAKQVMNLLK